MTAIEEIAAERQRQKEFHGWSEERDDKEHSNGALAAVAACYASPFVLKYDGYGGHIDECKIMENGDPQLPLGWPTDWDDSWWKPTNRRRDLVKAGALIVAEIERLDRAENTDT